MVILIRDDLVVGRHGDIPVRRYFPETHHSTSRRAGDTVVWLHGGAFSHGDLDMPESDAVARALAVRGCHVVAVDYRRVPPWSWWRQPAKQPLQGIRYPVPVDDVLDVVGVERARADAAGVGLVLGGASAGACLAAAASLRLQSAQAAGPDRQILAYGSFHAALPTPSLQLRSRIRGRYGLLQFRESTVERMNRNYAGSIEAMGDAFAFPGGHDLRGMPSALILDADRDSLRASGEAFAQELAVAGVLVVRETVPESTHGFLNRPGTQEFEYGIKKMARWLASSNVLTEDNSVAEAF